MFCLLTNQTPHLQLPMLALNNSVWCAPSPQDKLIYAHLQLPKLNFAQVCEKESLKHMGTGKGQ
jgi:hypothetical protein